MGIAVINIYLLAAYNINKRRHMCAEVEVVLLVRKVQCNVYSLVSKGLFEKKLLICYL